MSDKIAILGAGSWGITLGKLLAEKGHKVSLWEPDKKLARILDSQRSFKFLPGLKIPADILISQEADKVLSGANIIILAVPSQFMGEVARNITPLVKDKRVITVIATKGIESNTSLRMSEILAQHFTPGLAENITVLSGPTIAVEVMKKMPAAAVVACAREDIARYVQDSFITPEFRLYTSTDVIGVELGGSVKNIIAIAAGISDGLGLGTNSKAALMTRGIVEIIRLGLVLGARAETFNGLSGIGDLITTCISKYSRNRTFGEKIGQGKTAEKALAEIEMVVEGVKTTEGVYNLAAKHNIQMPITTEIYNILFKGKDPKKAVGDLMMRQAKPED